MAQRHAGLFLEARVPANGIALNLLSRRQAGVDGDTVLFLHGFPTNSACWAGVMAHLPQAVHPHAADLRGYNLSSAPQKAQGYRMADGVADIAAVIEQLSPDRPVDLVGHDVGGMLAYTLAAERPDLVRKLVVINGVHPIAFRHALTTDRAQIMASVYLDFMAEPWAADVLGALDFRLLRGTLRRMLNGHALDPAVEDHLLRSWARPGALRGMLNWYVANRFYRADPEAVITPPALTQEAAARCRISQPHLLIWGTPDPFLHMVNARLAAAFCDRIKLLRLPGAGHAPQLTRPAEVADHIAAFLGQPV